jgi:nucleoside-diphosphate-sugar epimerase
VALAEAAGRAERLLGRRTESNATSVRYLARTGTYSAAKAADLLGWVPAVDLADGMGRTEEWLRAEGLL